MLKKKNRVDKAVFKDILQKGFRFYSQNVSLRTTRAVNSRFKFAVSVSKKELKTAVKRNLLRRRVYSILRELKTKIKTPLNSVFFLKKEAIELPYSKLKDEVVFLLKKARII